ncbi:hypothetical protein [Stutzerimonas xanthomarina]|uniref:hypothetical protein n=1 Tax=Stutzerimonas xanthomarina TaxID=271420 RepID=UPI003AA96922
MTEADIQNKQQEETGDILRNFIEELDVDEELHRYSSRRFHLTRRDRYVPMEKCSALKASTKYRQ